jgi:hypothetical protein
VRGELQKECRFCKTVKPLTDFGYKDSKHASRRLKCKECEKIYKQHPKYKKQQKEYTAEKRKNPLAKQKMMEQCRNYTNSIRGRSKRLFLAAKYRAKINNLDFEITEAYIEVLLQIGVCQKTGISFDLSSPKGTNYNPYAPSIDRKNPFEGYTFSNTQLVCNSYNLAKNQMTDIQFIEFCKIVIARNS